MLLTITTTHRPATDLGFLLHKNPAKAQSFDLSVGKAHVFYPEATEERCTVALIIDINPVTLARTSRRASLRQYVNDRAYVATRSWPSRTSSTSDSPRGVLASI